MLGTGFCGSLTTFSSWMHDVFVAFAQLDAGVYSPNRFSGVRRFVWDLDDCTDIDLIRSPPPVFLGVSKHDHHPLPRHLVPPPRHSPLFLPPFRPSLVPPGPSSSSQPLLSTHLLPRRIAPPRSPLLHRGPPPPHPRPSFLPRESHFRDSLRSPRHNSSIRTLTSTQQDQPGVPDRNSRRQLFCGPHIRHHRLAAAEWPDWRVGVCGTAGCARWILWQLEYGQYVCG